MKKVLIISNSEICYHPRILKSADSFHERGYDVQVYCPLIGAAPYEVERKVVLRRKWKVIIRDLRQKNPKSFPLWLGTSLLQKIIRILWNRFRVTWGYNFYFSKGLLLANVLFKMQFDIIYIILVDVLPFAVQVKKRNPGSLLIYDSQEYFQGQYHRAHRDIRDWIEQAERKSIKSVDLVLTPTYAMLDKVYKSLNLRIPALRVRNVPYKLGSPTVGTKRLSKTPLRLIWVGQTLYYENCRGLHILMRALSQCTTQNYLTLQGKAVEKESNNIFNGANKLGIDKYLITRPPADPDQVIESLAGYHIGVLGDLPYEVNQELTSSNKLFFYIAAGLAVLAPNLPGLAETISNYKVGELYNPGDTLELASRIDFLHQHPSRLNAYQDQSKKVRASLTWRNEFAPVITKIESALAERI